jgi:hypothetical protein
MRRWSGQAASTPRLLAAYELDAVVRSRPREAVGVEEGEERDLEVGAGHGAAEAAVLKDRPEGGDPSSSGMPREQGGEGGGASEAPDLRLGDRRFELLPGQGAGDVEERAGRR